jgi:ATP-dependent DNA helicase
MVASDVVARDVCCCVWHVVMVVYSQEIVAAEQRNRVVSKLHAILRPFMLRRLKSDVDIQLPAKSELILYAPMSESQRQINTQIKEGTIMVSE